MGLRALWFGSVMALAIAGCGSTSTLSAGHARAADHGISLALTTTDGRIVELADQRGGLVLLFVLATYDGLSQAAIRPVSRFTREANDTVVLGVVAERDAESFAPIYASTFTPPYTVVFDPTESVALGTSPLGPLPAVPTFYMIDAHGVVSDRHSGYLSEQELFAMRDRARSHGGITSE